jgi:hypothetical protein
MPLTHERAAHPPRYRRDDFVAVVEHLVPLANRQLERLGLYILVCAFWALIIYSALTFAVQ